MTYQYMIAYKLPWNDQIDVYGPFLSHDHARQWINLKREFPKFRNPEYAQIVTLQVPDDKELWDAEQRTPAYWQYDYGKE